MRVSRQVFLAAEGTLIGNPDLIRKIAGAAVDSRQVKPNDLFIPLPGEKTDGHKYIEEAIKRGASAVLVGKAYWKEHEEELIRFSGPAGGDGRILFSVVKDTLEALQRMAACKMSEHPGLFTIGITGSNGKTTTKEFVGRLLSGLGNVFISLGNFNSDIGLCLEVLKIPETAEYAVFEMGTNRRGEMALLTGIVRPRLAVITNIGTAHIGIFGSKEAIAEEKKNISAYTGPEGAVFIHEDEPYSAFLTSDTEGSVISFGRRSMETAAGLQDVVSRGLDGSRLVFRNGFTIDVPVAGAYNLDNFFAAAAVALYFGISLEKIKAAAETFKPLFGRSEVIQGKITLIQDCYNANPDSMLQSVRFLDEVEWKGRKIAVLADMKELGEHAAEAHERIGAELGRCRFDRIYLYGSDMLSAYHRACAAGLRNMYHTAVFEELSADFGKYIREGDLVLLKGSRSMELEKLTDPLMEKKKENIVC